MLKFNPKADISWTSFHSVTITLDPRDLLELFPDYVYGGDKTSREWYFEFDGDIYTVYDWKETSLYDSGLPDPQDFWSLPLVTLHVGSRKNSFYEGLFVDALSDVLWSRGTVACSQ